MNQEFKSELDLYNRLKPALITKKNEMNRAGYNYIKGEDIWNYLKEVKWLNSSNLLLHEMVSDVLNCNNEIIDNYLKQKLNLKDRTLYFEQ